VVDRSGPKPLYLLVLQGAGHWSPPKGHVEEGEDERETATREIKEETGLDVEFIGEFKTQSQYAPKPGVMKTVIFFLAEPAGGKLQSNGTDSVDCQWFTLNDAKDRIIYQDTKEVLDEADAYLQSMV